MPKDTVMIRVAVATRDRLAEVLRQIKRARGGRSKLPGWLARMVKGTLNDALVELLDRHDRHQARNRKASAVAREKRRACQAPAQLAGPVAGTNGRGEAVSLPEGVDDE